MSSPLPRYYIEGLESVSASQETGIVKLTFCLVDQDSREPVFQMILSARSLHQIMAEISEKMKSTFGGGPGGPQTKTSRKDAELPDITSA